MEEFGAIVGRGIALFSPQAGAIALVVLLGILGAALVWRRIAPLREHVRLANEKNDTTQRGISLDE